VFHKELNIISICFEVVILNALLRLTLSPSTCNGLIHALAGMLHIGCLYYVGVCQRKFCIHLINWCTGTATSVNVWKLSIWTCPASTDLAR